LKDTPIDVYTFRSRPPHSGHSVSAASVNFWTASNA
jgi:hypothetical protein